MKLFFIKHLFLLFLYPAIVFSLLQAESTQEVKIGVLAKRGYESTLSRWTPLANYLNTQLSNYHFTIVPLPFNETKSAVRNHSVDFILVNPSLYIALEQKYGVSRIATMQNRVGDGEVLSEFGGVIFTKADRDDINNISDLRGKIFAAVDELSFGGWQTAHIEMQEQGLKSIEEFKELIFSKSHDNVVYDVLIGKADAGTVRTDTLEQMHLEGKIKLSDFKVINQKNYPGFPMLVSTILYPEWPFSKVKETSHELANDVAVALMLLPKNLDIAKKCSIAGWTTPHDYTPVKLALDKLEINGYAKSKKHEIELSEQEINWLNDHPKIRLGIDREWAPLEYLNQDNKLAGLSGNIIEKMQDMLGVKFIINTKLNWQESIAKAKNKEIDIFSSIRETPYRKEYLSFSEPYISIPNFIFTGSSARHISSVDQLSGKKVAVIKGYAVEDYITNNYSDIKLIGVSTVEEGLKALFDGKVDAFVDSSIVTNYYIGKLGYTNLQISGQLDYSYDLAMGVRDDWPILHSILQKSLDAIGEKEIQKFYKENITITYEEGINYDLLVKIFVVIFIILAAIVYWNRRLSREVSLRQAAEEEASAANAAKSMFLANMSHEIRTPMNAVMGMLYLVQRTELNDTQTNYLSKAHSAAASLLGLINDILDFSKMEADKLTLESVEFDLEKVITNLSNIIAYKAEDKGIEFLVYHDKDIPNMLIGDSLRLGQILINLANNAVKFTSEGEVVLREKLIEDDGENITIQFCIKDSGIGMSKDELKKLFHEFTQVDSSMTRKYGGTGLGLTISKKLVAMMDGKIWVESSEVGKGSTFCFSVKMKKYIHDVKEISKNNKRPEILNNMRVLVIDDNKSARDILKDMLESFDFVVDTASSGKKAISAIKQLDDNSMYSLILVDWMMPEMDGIETSEIIRGMQGAIEQVKIIMVTSYGKEEIMAEAGDAGLDGFLVKPVYPSLLFNTIMSLFGQNVKSEVIIEEEISLEDIYGAKILLAEDNEMNQEFATTLLTNSGLEVALAKDGVEALDMIVGKSYDAVLMDIQMPRMDGIEATQKIRKLSQDTGDSYYKDIPIIAMTAHAMAGDREKSIAIGMNDHVTKPIDPDILFSTLLKWIKPRKHSGVKKVQKTDDTSIDFSMLKEINVDEALHRLANDSKTYKRVLLKFKEKYTSIVSEIESKIDKESIESAEAKCHEFKGVSGNIGASKLFKLTTELDDILKSEKVPSKELFEDVERELKVVIDSIEVFEKEQKEQESQLTLSEEFNPQKVVEILNDMLKNIDTDIGLVEENLELLEPLVASSSELKTFEELSEKIRNFEIDEARVMIEELIDKLKEK